jgi:hypothetical protein
VAGRRVRVLAAGGREKGLHAVTWDGMDETGRLARPGVYFYRLLVDDKLAGNRRVVILK